MKSNDMNEKLVDFLLSAEIKECPDHPDCKDPKSTHYFMCHMSQDEFSQKMKEAFPDGKLPSFTFNKIKRKPHGSSDH